MTTSHEQVDREPATTPSARNPGMPLDGAWVREASVDDASVARAAAEPTTADPAALLDVIRRIDLTTLAADDLPADVVRVCARARRPLAADPGSAMGVRRLRTAAVCVHHAFIGTALEALSGSGIPVAAVSAGFPDGLSALPARSAEIRASVAAGATEIDAVIRRTHVLTGAWDALYDEVAAFRDACGEARLKVILATGELPDPVAIARAGLVCMMAGAEFLKTSTGRERINATPPAGIVMMRAIRAYAARTGHVVGFKAAGGIRSGDDAVRWMDLVRRELGPDALAPDRFRIGASSLLDDIERRLGSRFGAAASTDAATHG